MRNYTIDEVMGAIMGMLPSPVSYFKRDWSDFRRSSTRRIQVVVLP